MSKKKGKKGVAGVAEVPNPLTRMPSMDSEVRKAARLEEELSEATYKLKKLEDAQRGDKSTFKTMEQKVVDIERELDDIQMFMTGNHYHKKKEKKMKKAATAALFATRKQAKKDKKLGKKGELWTSPNTIKTIMELEKRSMEGISEEEMKELKFVWCLVFDMPDKSHAKTNTKGANGDNDDDDNGDDDLLGGPIGGIYSGNLNLNDVTPSRPKVTASHAELEISQEAWVACEKIVGADLVFKHVVPMDRRFLILAVGARQEILEDEATTIGLLMRLQESKGGMRYHPDLRRYFAAFHGGLNEYDNFIWKRRAGADLRLHFKDDENLSAREIEDRVARNKEIFTSGLAQRCVMSRLTRKGRYSPERQLIIGAGSPKPLGSKSGPHVAALKKVQARIERQRTLAASTLHALMVLYGGYRPQAANVFPREESSPDDPLIALLGTAILQDAQFVLTKKGCQTHTQGGLAELITYEFCERVCNILAEWRNPEGGAGRQEVWFGTLNSYFPLHDYKELAYLRHEWGTPRCILKPVLIGYSAEGEPAVYEAGPPKLSEHNTIGSAGNILHEHSWPSSMVYQPLEEVRDYFGDDVGLYFSWLGIYTRMLFLQSVFGCITLGCQLAYGGITNNPATFQYSIYVGLWSISFLETWKRKQNELQFLWSTADLSSVEEPRTTFVGELKTQQETGRQVLDHVSGTRYGLKQGAGMMASFTFILFTVASALAAQVVRYIPPDCVNDPDRATEVSPFTAECTTMQDKKYTLMSSFLNLMIIGVYGQLFERFAVKSTEWENHRTQSQYDNALVAKNFLFQFVNNYFVLFYIAYGREIEDPISNEAHPCQGGNCLPALQQQLLVVFTGKTLAKQTSQTLKPFVYRLRKKISDNKHTSALTKAVAKGKLLMPDEMSKALNEVVGATGGRKDPIQQMKALQKIRDPYELQNRLMPFAGTFDDFNDRVIQFGYIVLFAPAFPLAPFLAFINNIIEIRTAGFKMCHAFQRPIFKPRAGIGSWMVVLNALGYMAVLTNASMITFVGSQDADNLGIETTGMTDRTHQYPLWLRFVVVEHCVLSLRTFLMVLSPAIPAWINEASEVLDFRKANRYRTKEDIEADKRLEEQYQKKMNDGYSILGKTMRYKTRSQMRQLYDSIDEDGGGNLDGNEIAMLFQLAGVYLNIDEMDSVMAEIDEGGDEQVSFEELTTWMIAKDLWRPDDAAAGYRPPEHDGIAMEPGGDELNDPATPTVFEDEGSSANGSKKNKKVSPKKNDKKAAKEAKAKAAAEAKEAKKQAEQRKKEAKEASKKAKKEDVEDAKKAEEDAVKEAAAAAERARIAAEKQANAPPPFDASGYDLTDPKQQSKARKAAAASVEVGEKFVDPVTGKTMRKKDKGAERKPAPSAPRVPPSNDDV